MNPEVAGDEDGFRKVLNRHVLLPLGLGLLGALVFVLLIGYLLSVLKAVTESDETLRTANHALKLVIDLETGMRGYLLTGDERFLDPMEAAQPQLIADLDLLSGMSLAGPHQLRSEEHTSELQSRENLV